METLPLTREQIEALIKTIEEERQKYMAEVNFRLGIFDGKIGTLRAFLNEMQQPETTSSDAPPSEPAKEEEA